MSIVIPVIRVDLTHSEQHSAKDAESSRRAKRQLQDYCQRLWTILAPYEHYESLPRCTRSIARLTFFYLEREFGRMVVVRLLGRTAINILARTVTFGPCERCHSRTHDHLFANDRTIDFEW